MRCVHTGQAEPVILLRHRLSAVWCLFYSPQRYLTQVCQLYPCSITGCYSDIVGNCTEAKRGHREGRFFDRWRETVTPQGDKLEKRLSKQKSGETFTAKQIHILMITYLICMVCIWDCPFSNRVSKNKVKMYQKDERETSLVHPLVVGSIMGHKQRLPDYIRPGLKPKSNSILDGRTVAWLTAELCSDGCKRNPTPRCGCSHLGDISPRWQHSYQDILILFLYSGRYQSLFRQVNSYVAEFPHRFIGLLLACMLGCSAGVGAHLYMHGVDDVEEVFYHSHSLQGWVFLSRISIRTLKHRDGGSAECPTSEMTWK